MEEQDYWYCGLYLSSAARQWLAAALNENPNQSLSKLWRAALRDAKTPLNIRQALQRAHSHALAAAQKSWISSDWQLVTLRDEVYPSGWLRLSDPPLAVWVCGDKRLLQQAGIAIVGTRQPTILGRQLAKEWAQDFASNGLCVVSGLAAGIDTAAHQGALTVAGPTLAVMGTGPDRIYPAFNRGLAEQVATEGLLVSEFPVGRRVAKYHFPQRNRLIAAFSVATIVVEAAEQSGSLITARLAAEYGRDIFAVPGSVNNPMTAGCHKLLREGAHVATCPDDVYAILSMHTAARQPIKAGLPSLPEDSEEARLCALLAGGWCSIDEICEVLSVETEVAVRTLLRLELEGYVVSDAGGYRLHPEKRIMPE